MILLAASDGGDQLLTGLGQLGVAGAILALLLTFGNQVLKRERDRADANASEVSRLNLSIQEKYIPSMISGQEALSESNKVLYEMKDLVVELRAELKELRRKRPPR